ncbi:MAG: hypothetical protein GX790_02560 [Syntrophomonadaceae bacterium]|nr:hypothetical protein [Syntrophomonadaceae bacterium]
MLYEYQVATTQDSNYIVNEFENRLKWLQQKGYSLNIDALNNNKFYSLYKLKLQGVKPDNVFREEDILYIFKHQMSEVLAEHIIKDWEKKLLWKEIMRTCKKHTLEEKKIIFEKSDDFLKRCNDNESLNFLINYSRKNKMAHRILEHINSSNLIVIEGFINFCLKDYLNEIRFAVDLAVEELRNEKEYNEFVKLLRYFVDTQVPKSYEVNLMMNGKGIFYLWDAQGSSIEDKYINYYLDDMLLDEINLDDILISILITIAPRRIILHNVLDYVNTDAVEVIRNVFQEKISICSGCERCRSYLQEKDQSKN